MVHVRMSRSHCAVDIVFHFRGADLAALVRESCVAALKQKLLSASTGAESGKSEVRKEHMEEAMNNVRCSVNPIDRMRYETLRQTYSLSHRK
jgi:SpoVK/Ycf46/Vps4 family AAA+-type ATPase